MFQPAFIPVSSSTSQSLTAPGFDASVVGGASVVSFVGGSMAAASIIVIDLLVATLLVSLVIISILVSILTS